MATSVPLYGQSPAPTGSSPANPAPARVTLGTLELPTYREGPPDPNPPFDAFLPPRVNYPYTLRTNLTDDSAPRAWRALFLENDYLRCSVLPDLGGHLYSCTDKVSGEEMFYANPSIKLTQIGYRGAWAALGIEFNFPVSHNWMSTSPVDFAFREAPDGSASVWVGNIDRVYGTDWRVQLTLRPGRAVLEQHTTLYNRSDVRHRYYWWTNAAVEVTDESWVLYPMRTTASHGFTDIDTWPIDARGTDNSLVANHLFGPVSRFSHGSREPFMAVYHPGSDSGVMHFSAADHLPSKKIWSWGGDARGLDWRRALSDDSSAYVEIQAGVFRNQETYGFLEPQEVLTFSEYWTPLRGLGGLSRANPEVQAHLCRTDACGSLPSPGLVRSGAGDLRVRMNTTAFFPAASVSIARGSMSVHEERVDLDPWTTYDTVLANTGTEDAYTLRVLAADGAVLLEHTEGEYDYEPEGSVALGPTEPWSLPHVGLRSESDYLFWIDDLERNGRRVEAWRASGQALDRFAGSLALTRAAGRLAVVLRRYDEGAELLERAASRVDNDAEVAYYLGVARAGLGDTRRARTAFEGALHDARFRAAARIRLGVLAAAAHDVEAAVSNLAAALRAQPRAPRTAALLSAALRAADRESDALQLVDQMLGAFPSHSFLRYEATLLGASDPPLWVHLVGDPERILEIATEYQEMGLFEEALELLSRNDSGEGIVHEPGIVAPEQYVLLQYHRAYAQAQSDRPHSATLDRAATLPAMFAFPNRAFTRRVLEWVLEERPTDGVAHWLLGALEVQSLRMAGAQSHWQRARDSGRRIPALHASLGTLLMRDGDTDQAVAVLLEGTGVDSLNTGVYAALDEALTLLGRGPSERADALLTYPDRAAMPASLVYMTARRLADAGRFDEADALFFDRFFPREEGGINVRQVYLEVRIGRARTLIDSGACERGVEVLDALLRPQRELPFTNDGLELWLNRSELDGEVARLRGRCSGAEGVR